MLKSITFIIILSFFFYGSNLCAEIIYTDLNPDLNILPDPGQSLTKYIDMDNDGVDEFAIGANNSENEYSKVTIRGYNESSQILGDGNISPIEDFHPLCLEKSDSISQYSEDLWHNDWDSYWGHSNPLTIKGYGINGDGNWINSGENNYIGVRFKINNVYHYGWIALEISEDSKSCIIKAYAYETEGNKLINAGETENLSVRDNLNEIDISIFPNPSQDYLNISMNSEILEPHVVQIFNLNGKMVFNKSIKNFHEIRLNINDLASGRYYLLFRSNKRTISREFVKK